MSIRQLRTLVAIADTGSFGAAAERLNMTYSAVCMQMKVFEESLGGTLFDRLRRPTTVCDSKKEFVERARHLISEYDELIISHELVDNIKSKNVRVGVIPSLTSYILPKAMMLMQHSEQRVSLQVKSGLSHQLLSMVEDDELDFAIITGYDIEINGIVSEKIIDEPINIVLHKDFFCENASELLEQYSLVRFNPRLGVGKIIDEALERHGIVVKSFIELDSIDTILNIVQSKIGIAIVPCKIISLETYQSLMMVPFDPVVTRSISIVSRQAARDEPEVKAISKVFRSLLLK